MADNPPTVASSFWTFHDVTDKNSDTTVLDARA
jgi:hypothetical protein